MSMSKKDYEAIAAELREAHACEINKDVVERVAYRIAKICSLGNDRFSSQRFLAACGVPGYSWKPAKAKPAICSGFAEGA